MWECVGRGGVLLPENVLVREVLVYCVSLLGSSVQEVAEIGNLVLEEPEATQL